VKTGGYEAEYGESTGGVIRCDEERNDDIRGSVFG